MLSQMKGVEASPVILFHKIEALAVNIRNRGAALVEMIERAETQLSFCHFAYGTSCAPPSLPKIDDPTLRS